MLVVDASCLFEVLIGTEKAPPVRQSFGDDPDQAAPHVIDVEVLNVLRRELIAGHLDPTAASQAVEDLRDWPAQRYGHRALLARAWELRANVRGWDAVYVALAEGLDATLITMDRRLGRIRGLRCHVQVLPAT